MRTRHTTAVTKCCRSSCQCTTHSPQGDGWIYMSEAPPEVSHWVGWWCPPCWEELDGWLIENGAEKVAGRLQ
jgi:hypothetical protein